MTAFDDSTHPYQPAEILSITAVQGIGNVELMVCPHEGLLYGATNVRLLQLNQTGVTGSVLDLLISGDLGADGPTIFANGGSAEGGALDFRNALSPITITGRLLGNFTCNSAGDITIAGDVVAGSTITLTNLDSLAIGTSDVPANLEGTLRLLNGLPQPPAPKNVVVIHGALNGTIDLNHGDVREGAMLRAMRGGHGHLINGGVIQPLGGVWFAITAPAPGEVPVFSGTATFQAIANAPDLSAVLECHGILEGTFHVIGDVGGQIWLAGAGDQANLAESGQIIVGGNLAGLIHVKDVQGRVQIGQVSGLVQIFGDILARADGEPNIRIFGDILAHADGEPSIRIGGDLAGGQMIVNGELAGDVSILGGFHHGPYPEAHFGSRSTGWFIVNDDGANSDDDVWAPDATVKIGLQTYEGHEPSAGVARASCWKGDMDCSEAVNAFDIDPFVQALSNPVGYLATYPYLKRGLLYRADLNCDSALNAFDIDAFVLRLTNPDEYRQRFAGCEVCTDTPPPPGEGPAGDGLHGEEAVADTPESVAQMFLASLSSESLSYMRQAAAELAAALADTERGDFWAGVAAELGG